MFPYIPSSFPKLFLAQWMSPIPRWPERTVDEQPVKTDRDPQGGQNVHSQQKAQVGPVEAPARGAGDWQLSFSGHGETPF